MGSRSKEGEGRGRDLRVRVDYLLFGGTRTREVFCFFCLFLCFWHGPDEKRRYLVVVKSVLVVGGLHWFRVTQEQSLESWGRSNNDFLSWRLL